MNHQPPPLIAVPLTSPTRPRQLTDFLLKHRGKLSRYHNRADERQPDLWLQ